MYYYFLFPFTLYSAVATLNATVIVRWKGWQKWYRSIVLIWILYVIHVCYFYTRHVLWWSLDLHSYTFFNYFYYEQKITRYICLCSLSRRAECCAEQKCSWREEVTHLRCTFPLQWMCQDCHPVRHQGGHLLLRQVCLQEHVVLTPLHFLC